MSTISRKEHMRRVAAIIEYLQTQESAQTHEIAEGVGLRRYATSRILGVLLRESAVSRKAEYEVTEKKRLGARWALVGKASATLPRDRVFAKTKAPPDRKRGCKRTAEGKARRNAAAAAATKKRNYIRTETKLAPLIAAIRGIGSGTTTEIAGIIGEEFHCVKRCLSILKERGQVAAEKGKVRKGYKDINVWRHVSDTPQALQTKEYQPRKPPLYDPNQDEEHMAWMQTNRGSWKERRPWVQW